MHVVVDRLAQADAEAVVVGAGRVDEADVVLREAHAAAAAQRDAVVARRAADGECTVQAKRWKKPLWMQPSANSWRTYSSPVDRRRESRSEAGRPSHPANQF